MKQFHVYCPFCSGATEEEVTDYHPLTAQELAQLLQEAVSIKVGMDENPYAVGELSNIQKRLRQAIPGMVCPYPSFGPLAERLCQVNNIFIEWIDNPDTVFFKDVVLHEESAIVVELMQLLQGEG